jgi:hypothetical protein
MIAVKGNSSEDESKHSSSEKDMSDGASPSFIFMPWVALMLATRLERSAAAPADAIFDLDCGRDPASFGLILLPLRTGLYEHRLGNLRSRCL